MLYRLNGDRNPLHIDPAIAKESGFDRPVLHGHSTFGVVGRALVHLCCGGDPARLNVMRVRFTSTVFPGDVIRIEVWEEGNVLRFLSSLRSDESRIGQERGSKCRCRCAPHKIKKNKKNTQIIIYK